MNFEFDFEKIESVEFGVGLGSPDEADFVSIPIENNVREALKEILANTKKALEKNSDTEEPEVYSPSERYNSLTALMKRIADLEGNRLTQLVTAQNLRIEAGLPALEEVSMYFARFFDDKHRVIVGVRRASQFKALLNRQNRIINWFHDALRIVENSLLKLDNDFDLLLNTNSVLILRPSSFEYLAVQDSDILAAVERNIEIIKNDVEFLNILNVENYAKGHIRAARMIASIRSFKPDGPVDEAKLRKACNRCGFKLQRQDQKLVVPDDKVVDLLEILDRRRYEVTLVSGKTEHYRATSRKRVRNNPVTAE